MMLIYYKVSLLPKLLKFLLSPLHTIYYYPTQSTLPSCDLPSCLQLQLPSRTDVENVTYTAAESEAAKLSCVSSRPCVAVLLWQ